MIGTLSVVAGVLAIILLLACWLGMVVAAVAMIKMGVEDWKNLRLKVESRCSVALGILFFGVWVLMSLAGVIQVLRFLAAL